MVTSDREVVAGLVMEVPDFTGATLLRAERVLAAMEALQKAGYVLVLLPAGTEVTIGSTKRRRRWWRRPNERRTHVQ